MIDIEGGTEFSRTVGEFDFSIDRAFGQHDFDSVDRLNRSNKNGGTSARSFGDDVQAILGVNRIDVQQARRSEHDSIAIGHAARGVTSRIGAPEIGFDFDDPAGYDTFRQSPHESLPEESTRYLQCWSLIEFRR